MPGKQSKREVPVGPLLENQVPPLQPGEFEGVLRPEQERELEETTARGRALLHGRVVWNVNSTARGGGVAEMLWSLIAYTRGGGIDARWMVIGGEPDFFRVTKRLHNRLHGYPGDGGPLGESERGIYEACSAVNARRLERLVSPGDVVLLHDPQTAALVAPMAARGAHVVWRAHIGLDLPNERARETWRFLSPYVEPAEAYVFSRDAFTWDGLDARRVAIIPPSIDPFSPKNRELGDAEAGRLLEAVGIVGDGGLDPARCVQEAPVPPGDPLVAQISRWDALKDPIGVLEGFIDHVAGPTDAHLLLAGPDPDGVADDPEAADVLAQCTARWRSLAPEVRRRVHLALLPMEDPEENALMVNALQRRADVVVQKSLAEGFGLTVAEAMWKGRPVVASRVGGIQDQIRDGESGCLVDPLDGAAFGGAVLGLLRDSERAARIGAAAAERVRADFLGPRHLRQYVELFARLIGAEEGARPG